MLKKLRTRFVFVTMTIITVMLLAIFGLILHFTAKNLEMQSIQMLQSISTEPIRPGDREHTPPGVHLPYFTLELGPDEKILTAGEDHFDLSDARVTRKLLFAAMDAPSDRGVLREYSLRFLRLDTPVGHRYAFADITAEEDTLRELFRSCLFVFFLSFFLFLALLIKIARWATLPTELSWKRQRQFVADASHELKTPLTVIMTNAELLQDPHYNEENRSQFINSILTMSRQMRGLVESLLDLAKLDNSSIQPLFSSLDLSQLILDAVLPFEALFFETGKTLECDVESGIRIRGSDTHLRQVVDILLDNALKYSTPDTAVELRLRRKGSHCTLTVASRGDTISKEDLVNIFKRFYRMDKTRSIGHSYGLGLSIAFWIVSEHRGKIWAESTEGINTFFVQLPL